MRKASLICACAAAAALVGATACAAQASGRSNVLSVQLPNGVIEQIHYAGNVAPQVNFTSNAIAQTAADPTLAAWSLDPSFAALDRLSAEMDQQMAALVSAAPDASYPVSTAPPLTRAALANAPAGAESYSVVSTFSGGHACTRTVQMTSEGPGKSPRVVSKTSGDCTAAAAPAAMGGGAASPDRAQT